MLSDRQAKVCAYRDTFAAFGALWRGGGGLRGSLRGSLRGNLRRGGAEVRRRRSRVRVRVRAQS